MTYGFPGSDFSEIRWEIFARTRRHTYSCLMYGMEGWRYMAGQEFDEFYHCDCDSGDIRGKYLGDLILLA